MLEVITFSLLNLSHTTNHKILGQEHTQNVTLWQNRQTKTLVHIFPNRVLFLIWNLLSSTIFFFFFSRQGFCVWFWSLSWHSLSGPGWPRTQRSACLCLPSAGIKGEHHHRLAWNAFLLGHDDVNLAGNRHQSSPTASKFYFFNVFISLWHF